MILRVKIQLNIIKYIKKLVMNVNRDLDGYIDIKIRIINLRLFPQLI